jgi:hypothetical protein
VGFLEGLYRSGRRDRGPGDLKKRHAMMVEVHEHDHPVGQIVEARPRGADRIFADRGGFERRHGTRLAAEA